MTKAPDNPPNDDWELIRGFIAGEGMAELRLLEVLRRIVRSVVKRLWPALWPALDDLTQTLYLHLFALRAVPKDQKQILPPLVELVTRLLNPEAKRLLREAGRRADLPRTETGTLASPDAALDGKRLCGFLAKLPEAQAAVLVHLAAEETGDGPPLHEALGTTPELARKRLAYARKLLFELVEPEAADD